MSSHGSVLAVLSRRGSAATMMCTRWRWRWWWWRWSVRSGCPHLGLVRGPQCPLIGGRGVALEGGKRCEASWVCVELRNVSTFPRRKDQGVYMHHTIPFPHFHSRQRPANRPFPEAITHGNSYSRMCHVMIFVSSHIPDPTHRIHLTPDASESCPS
jgi:hypothetical protein